MTSKYLLSAIETICSLKITTVECGWQSYALLGEKYVPLSGLTRHFSIDSAIIQALSFETSCEQEGNYS